MLRIYYVLYTLEVDIEFSFFHAVYGFFMIA